jgi:hypothetical protein
MKPCCESTRDREPGDPEAKNWCDEPSPVHGCILPDSHDFTPNGHRRHRDHIESKHRCKCGLTWVR